MKLYIITTYAIILGIPKPIAPIVCLSKREASRKLTELKKIHMPEYKNAAGKEFFCSHYPGEEISLYDQKNYTATHLTARICVVEKEQIKAKRQQPVEDIFKQFYMMPKVQRAGITDSLLLESGLTIAKGKTKDFSFIIETQGESRILWKGEVYKNGGDYPDELTELIRKHQVDGHPDAEIGNNNWYELVIINNNGKIIYSELLDIDLDTITEQEVKDIVEDTFNSIDIY